ncbi:MAG: hypothetical protein KAW41_03250 [Candidatus Diapherotrites archaeon]|nr:hypothetical protein [Candidatus Diapherotrites archaeon]
MLSVVQILKETNEDSEWVTTNYNQLKAKYGSKIIAVKNRQVIESGTDTVNLLKKLQSKGIDPRTVLLETMPPSSVSFIL